MPETFSRATRDIQGRGRGLIGRVHGTAARGASTLGLAWGGDRGRHAGRPATPAWPPGPRRDVAMLSQRLAALANGGLPLDRALGMVAAQAGEPRLADALRAVEAGVALGGSLSDELARHPTLFSQLHVAIVRAGEYAGAGRRGLADAADVLVRGVVWRDRIRTTVVQPLASFAGVLAIVTAAASALAPGFSRAYTALDALPLPTRALLGTIRVAGRVSLPIVIGATPAVLLLRDWLRGESGRARLHALRLRLPLLGPLERTTALAHATRAVAALVGLNMPVDQALALAAEDAPNAEIAAGLRDARATAAAGGSLAVALNARGLLRADTARILAASERSGALDAALAALADQLDRETDAVLRAVAGRLGPILLGVAALLVAGILVALYLPVAWLLP
jgi:type II secretory pathway component PulF